MTNTDYERDHSHMHCWEQKNPPCGQKIEHLKCCLCEKLNPTATSESGTPFVFNETINAVTEAYKSHQECCEKCADIYFEKNYPEHDSFPCCSNTDCPCHSSKASKTEPPVMKELAEESWEKAFVEAGAALEHARWARWQEYIFDCAIKSGDDNLRIRTFAWPTAQAENWQRQIDTPYQDLSDKEKESDRREVREYLPLIRKAIEQAREEGYKKGVVEQAIALDAEMIQALKDANVGDPLYEVFAERFEAGRAEAYQKVREVIAGRKDTRTYDDIADTLGANIINAILSDLDAAVAELQGIKN